MILRHLNTFLQFRLLFHEPHCTNVKCFVSNSKFFQFLSKIVFHWNKNDFKNRFLQTDNKYKESNTTVCSIWIYYDKRPISTSKWNTHTL